MRIYEAMFLFDPTFASDASNIEQEVRRLMDRAQAQIIKSDKWEERKLAYEIQGRKRGCYVLTFFKADPSKIAGIERDVQLSEPILRVLIQRADHMTEDDMAKAFAVRSQSASSGEDGRRRSRRSDDSESAGSRRRKSDDDSDGDDDADSDSAENDEKAEAVGSTAGGDDD